MATMYGNVEGGCAGIYIHLSFRGGGGVLQGYPTLMALVNKSIDSANCPQKAKCPFVPLGPLAKTLIVIDIVEIVIEAEAWWQRGVERGAVYIEHYVLCMSASNCPVCRPILHQRIPTCMQLSTLSLSHTLSLFLVSSLFLLVLIILHKYIDYFDSHFCFFFVSLSLSLSFMTLLICFSPS